MLSQTVFCSCTLPLHCLYANLGYSSMVYKRMMFWSNLSKVAFLRDLTWVSIQPYWFCTYCNHLEVDRAKERRIWGYSLHPLTFPIVTMVTWRRTSFWVGTQMQSCFRICNVTVFLLIAQNHSPLLLKVWLSPVSQTKNGQSTKSQRVAVQCVVSL